MSGAPKHGRYVSPRRRAGIYSILVLVLTSAHHAYGALAYHTLWRLHVAAIALPAALVIYVGLRAGARAYEAGKGRALSYWVSALILMVPVSAIGLFEGAYNHVLKNVLYFGWGVGAMRHYFSPPMYEMPNDRIFEGTGIVQFPLALMAAYWTIVLIAELRTPVTPKPPEQARSAPASPGQT